MGTECTDCRAMGLISQRDMLRATIKNGRYHYREHASDCAIVASKRRRLALDTSFAIFNQAGRFTESTRVPVAV